MCDKGTMETESIVVIAYERPGASQSDYNGIHFGSYVLTLTLTTTLRSPLSAFPLFRFYAFTLFSFSAFQLFRFSAFPLLRFSAFPLFRFSSFPLFRFSAFPFFTFHFSLCLLVMIMTSTTVIDSHFMSCSQAYIRQFWKTTEFTQFD